MKKIFLVLFLLTFLSTWNGSVAYAFNVISVNSLGVQSNWDSEASSISTNGGFVAFGSRATNLVPGQNQNRTFFDIFVRDLVHGKTEQVNVDSFGTPANGFSHWPSISASGRFVSFFSVASNLVPNDKNNGSDVFVHDRLTGVTERVSVDSNGVEGDNLNDWSELRSSISADGRYVAFPSPASNLVPGGRGKNNGDDIYVHDRLTRKIERISIDSNGVVENGSSSTPNISGDGRYICFISNATNLALNDTNGLRDVFVHDRLMGNTERVSVDSKGMEAKHGHSDGPCSLSADGRYVAFISGSDDLVWGDVNKNSDVFLHDRQTGTTEIVSHPCGNVRTARISPNGEYVAYDCGGNDIVVYERLSSRSSHLHILGPRNIDLTSAGQSLRIVFNSHFNAKFLPNDNNDGGIGSQQVFLEKVKFPPLPPNVTYVPGNDNPGSDNPGNTLVPILTQDPIPDPQPGTDINNSTLGSTFSLINTVSRYWDQLTGGQPTNFPEETVSVPVTEPLLPIIPSETVEPNPL